MRVIFRYCITPPESTEKISHLSACRKGCEIFADQQRDAAIELDVQFRVKIALCGQAGIRSIPWSMGTMRGTGTSSQTGRLLLLRAL